MILIEFRRELWSQKTSQIFTAFHQQFKCINHEYQMPIAHSLFKHTIFNVRSHQLQQHMIEICYNCLINELVKQIILYCQQNGLLSQHYVGQLWHVSLIVF